MNMRLNGKEVTEYKEFVKFKVLFSGIWLFVGIIFVCIAYFSFKSYKHRTEVCVEPITATVTFIEARETEDSDGNRSVNYFPEFTFTKDGESYSKMYNHGQSHSPYHLGDNVTLYINPDNYDEYLVAGDSSPKFTFIIFGGIGLVLILIGSLSAFLMKFKPQEEIDEETDEFIKENTISQEEYDRQQVKEDTPFETNYKDDGDSPFVK